MFGGGGVSSMDTFFIDWGKSSDTSDGLGGAVDGNEVGAFSIATSLGSGNVGVMGRDGRGNDLIGGRASGIVSLGVGSYGFDRTTETWGRAFTSFVSPVEDISGNVSPSYGKVYFRSPGWTDVVNLSKKD